MIIQCNTTCFDRHSDVKISFSKTMITITLQSMTIVDCLSDYCYWAQNESVNIKNCKCLVSNYTNTCMKLWVAVARHNFKWLEIYSIQPFKPSRCIKASFYFSENRLNFPTTKASRMKISMKLAYQYMAIFFNFSTTSNHLHLLQVENCDSN